MKITELYIYPVKSLAGISLSASELKHAGLEFDRQWMVVKPDGTFMTQRSHPQMALIETQIVEGQLVLSTFGMDSHTVEHIDKMHCPRLHTKVWGDAVNALEHNTQTNAWLSQAIGEECKLVSFPQEEIRQCDPAVSETGEHTLFSDDFPLLLISRESLDDLNSRLEKPVGMDRFRPNIVVSGCEPFAEDDWVKISLNHVRNGDHPVHPSIHLRAVQGCPRCSVPTVDQQTGVLSGPEPIHTLSSYRRKDDGEVYFGMNLIPESTGMIHVGDQLKVAAQT